MKNIVVLLGLVASFVLFTGCSSNNAADAGMSSAPASAPAHHDYKGEG